MFRGVVYWLGVVCAVASLTLFIKLFLVLAPERGSVALTAPQLKAQIMTIDASGEPEAAPRRVILLAGGGLGLASAAATLITAGRRGTRRELFLD
jgi:hypothetical protein